MQVISAKMPVLPGAPSPSVAQGGLKASAASGKAAAPSLFGGIVLQLLPAERPASLRLAGSGQGLELLPAAKPAISAKAAASAPIPLLSGKPAVIEAKPGTAASIDPGAGPRNTIAPALSAAPATAAPPSSPSRIEGDPVAAPASLASSGDALSAPPAAAKPLAIPSQAPAEADSQIPELRPQAAKKADVCAPQEHPAEKRTAPRTSKTSSVSGAVLPSAAAMALSPALSGICPVSLPQPKQSSGSANPPGIPAPSSRPASIPSIARAPQNTAAQRPGTDPATVPASHAGEHPPATGQSRGLPESASPFSPSAAGSSASHLPTPAAAAAPLANLPHVSPHASIALPDIAPPAAPLHAAPFTAQAPIVSHVLHAASAPGVSPFERMDAVAAPQVLESTTQRLAVGVRAPGLGWVEIRTHLAGGEVAATLAATSTESHAVLAAHLPAMQNDLAPQHIRLENGAAQNFSSSGQNHGGSSAHHDQPPAAQNSRIPEPARAGPVPPGEAAAESLSYISVRV